jgi:CopG family nickel-responsive transcriptional regulator
MEVTVLKGQGAAVKHFAEHVISERGVRHGHVVYVPGDGARAPHSHGKPHAHGAKRRPRATKRG